MATEVFMGGGAGNSVAQLPKGMSRKIIARQHDAGGLGKYLWTAGRAPDILSFPNPRHQDGMVEIWRV